MTSAPFAAWRRLSLRGKLVLVIMLATASALLLASVGLVAADRVRFRRETRGELGALAAVLAENSTAALSFDDPVAAAETLGALRARADVDRGCLWDGAGALFASYVARGVDRPCPKTAPPPGGRFGEASYEVVRPVELGGKQIGVILVESSLEDLERRLRLQLVTMSGVLVLSALAALALSTLLQRLVSRPIVGLAEAAGHAAAGDYRVRPLTAGDDEVGRLVAAFHTMLERIESRERDLSAANEELRREVAERRRVEGERTAALGRERDARRQAEEANRLKDEFLATLSHELRTPLNAILGWATVLRAGRIDAATAERAVEAVERNARAQAQLVADLLDVSRIVTGKLRLDLQPLDLGNVLAAVEDTVRPAAEAKRLAITVRRGSYPNPIVGDPDRLTQVMWNLLANAIKFTPAGGRIEVTLGGTAEEAELVVRDEGIGIAAEFLPHVFDRFRQAHGGPSRAYGGLGLGLALVRHLVELHGGSASAESAGEGHGSTFRVRLPVRAAAAAAAPAATPQAPWVPEPILAGVKVLVVEDEPEAAELARTALAQCGAETRTASSAATALEALDREVPDVLVSDIELPGDDGYALIRRVRQRPADRGGAVPALALTAYAGPADRERALAAGFQQHLAKPVLPGALAAAVAALAPRPRAAAASADG